MSGLVVKTKISFFYDASGLGISHSFEDLKTRKMWEIVS